jgi:hypothetical protein
VVVGSRNVGALQKAREDREWVAAQETKLAAFVRQRGLTALTLTSLSKPQQVLLESIAVEYHLVARPSQGGGGLGGHASLQLLKGAASVIPVPSLADVARTVTDEDVARLVAKEAASCFEMRFGTDASNTINLLDFRERVLLEWRHMGVTRGRCVGNAGSRNTECDSPSRARSCRMLHDSAYIS